jgi:carbamoyl-phosphate synthase large subunit
MKVPKKYNVLVFPCGTEIGLEIHRSLSNCKEVKLFGCASIDNHHGELVFECYRQVKSVKNDCFLEEFNALLQEWNIDFIFPANPVVIDYLNFNRKYLVAKLLLSNFETIELTRSKRRTYDLLKDVIDVPVLYEKVEKSMDFPIFVKPDRMYGSQGAMKIESFEGYLLASVSKDDVVSEYLPNEEYTIDCFTDKNGKLRYVGPRTRDRVRMGTSMRCRFVPDTVRGILIRMADVINSSMELRGAWFFQVKADTFGTLKLLEIEARIAGTMAFQRVQGINLPLLTLFDAIGLDVHFYINELNFFIDRALMNRYQVNLDFDVVYIDLDDTIISNGLLNLEVVHFLYQCVNNGKKIILLSKSTDVFVEKTLQKLKIFHIFDEIHWLREEESKSSYIHEMNSIFIDDSFSQRMDVANSCSIKTFDPSMIELLINFKK